MDRWHISFDSLELLLSNKNIFALFIKKIELFEGWLSAVQSFPSSHYLGLNLPRQFAFISLDENVSLKISYLVTVS